MSAATTLANWKRVGNYSYQDFCTHKHVGKYCPTYMTPKQRRRVDKKMRHAQRKGLVERGLTFVKSPF